MKRLNRRIYRPSKLVMVILLGGLLAAAGCKAEEEDTSTTALMLGLVALTTAQNPGSCSFTFGSRTVNIQEYSLGVGSTLTFSNGFTYLFKNWAAVKVAGAANGTSITFNFTPWYVAGGNTYYLVYNESGCAITNSSNADMNYTFPELSSTRTPTNYSVSDNVLTFDADSTGKDFVIVVGTSSVGSSPSVTRAP